MPMQPDLYPANWKQLAESLKEQANWTCERCGAQRGQIVKNRHGKEIPVVITVAHPNHDPRNPQARLAVWCAQCHCRYDAADRRRQRVMMRIARGQGVLPGLEEWYMPPRKGGQRRKRERRAKNNLVYCGRSTRLP
ncbi:MAG TPA: hypothetical protein VGT44_15125 [Ktedonobacteraceae bacterium]|nr:hypothetical protein [Ktedonobacteraceae bacterium]